MKDAFERRALLLHLGAVLDAMDKVLSHSGDRTAAVTLRELESAQRSLAKLPLLQHVSREMTAHEFVQRVSATFACWPAELLEAELNRERLAAVVRDALFAANDEGWRAYVASLKGEVPWFGDGLPPLPHLATESAVTAEQKKPTQKSEKLRDAQHEEPATEGAGGLYPSWPWKPQC
jgi:hypothetical protein